MWILIFWSGKGTVYVKYRDAIFVITKTSRINRGYMISLLFFIMICIVIQSIEKKIKFTPNVPKIGKKELNPKLYTASTGLYQVKPVNIKLLIYSNNVKTVGTYSNIHKLKYFCFKYVILEILLAKANKIDKIKILESVITITIASLSVAKIRAIESQKPLVYVVNNGISAFINKNGLIKYSSDFSDYETVTPQKGKTLWLKYGNFILLFYILFIYLLYFILSLKTIR